MLATAYPKIEPDSEHQRIINEASQHASTYFDESKNLLRTHTIALARCEHKGIFKTISPGTNLTDPNCFAYPLADGAWVVYRYGTRTREAETWTHDEQWTHCRYNCFTGWFSV